jgi:glucose/arabinose dehydrogenase
MRAALLGLALTLALAAPATAAPRLVSIGSFSQPVHVASPPNDPRIFVVEKGGLVKIAGGGPFLDVRASTDSNEEERGLLSIAFPPDYASTGYFYVFRTAADPDGQLQVVEFRRSADPNRADPASGRVVLRIDHARENHNGGQLQFGPDGYLYVGTGDGGGANDPDGNGQKTNTELGKILRIVARTGAAAPGNPFGNRVWSYGLRNPWRFTWDRETGDMWIADVGQNAWEEVDFLPAGQGAGSNFGWNRLEGTHAFQGEAPRDAVPPILEYPLDGACAAIGGYVYRGSKIPALAGAYLYSDYCDGAIRAIVEQNGQVADRRELGMTASQVTAFGEDQDGELYVLSQGDGLQRIDPA